MRSASLGVLEAGILVVDDHPINVRLIERVLTRAGYFMVHTATTASDVLPAVRAFRPDLIILDLNMPPLGGFWVMEQLQAEASDPARIILVLTAEATRQVPTRRACAATRAPAASPCS